MNTQTIYIKHMCCQRCIEAVQTELTSLGLKVKNVELGEASFTEPSKIKVDSIANALKKRGFELIKSEDELLVETIKTAVIDLIHYSDNVGNDKKIHLQEFLEQKIKKSYSRIQKVFSLHTNMTIEKYIILQRLEKVKEKIEESNLNLSEIAYAMGYKTLQHLSAQFKKITGVTMMEYKKAKKTDRKAFDEI